MSNKYIDYFYSRGIRDGTISDFELGYYDEFEHCSKAEFIPFVDYRFKGKVLFPIKDLYNNLIAVASRSIEGKDYIHSKYSKRFHLFGLNVTCTEILKTGKVFIVEGNFDLLTLYEHGIKNVVAMLGSKLSVEQLSLLMRFADEFIIATDPDKSGQDCAKKIIEMLKEDNLAYRQINLPERSDPDSFIRSHGVDAFLRLLPSGLAERIENINDRDKLQR